MQTSDAGGGMGLKSLALAAALVLAAANAQALVGSSEPASADAAASAVMVLKQGKGGAAFCTGVALSRTAVLTAGHCVTGAQSLAVNYGGYGQPRLVNVTGVSVHPEFVPDAVRKRVRSIDLAIVRLAEPLPASITPARLDAQGEVKAGQRFTIAGFGLAREGEEASAGRLRMGSLVAREPVSKILLWAHDPAAKGFGACTGDSGGPIFAADGSVAAITTWSTGAGKKRCGDITQGALVAPQRGWIERVLGDRR
ncbi:MAG: S1 family peptidase [Beijerinckiaceae bacterium]|nr:S1 family peptidase [Beijerinckiaceae bacterium]